MHKPQNKHNRTDLRTTIKVISLQQPARIVASLTFGYFLATTGNVFAESEQVAEITQKKAEEQSTTLQKITVKAQVEKLPVGSHKISSEVLERTQATDLKDIFETEPSVTVSGGGRNAQRIYLRGIEGSNLNITIDGAKQGRSLHQHRGNMGGIDPDILKSVEVQPGPGADRGSGALGGSISFETVDAQDLLDPGRKIGALLKTSYGSAAQSLRGVTTVYGLLADGIGLLAHISAENRENYRIGGGGEVPNPSYKSLTSGKDRDYFLKFSLLEKAGHSLRVSAEKNSNAGYYLEGGNGSDMGYASINSKPVYQTIARENYTLDHRYKTANPFVDSKFVLYHNDAKLKMPGSGVSGTNSSISTGGDIRNTMRFNLWKTNHSLTIGSDYNYETIKSAHATGATARADSQNLGLFLQNRMGIGSLTISFGTRFDYFDAGYLYSSYTGHEFSPNAGAEYELVKGLVLYTNYGESTRATGLIPVVWMPFITPTVKLNNGAGLKPESSQQIAGGIRYKTEGLFTQGDRFHTEASVFETRMKNLIERTSGGGSTPITNIWNNPNTITSMGYDLRFGWGVGGFDTSVAYSHVSLDENDKPVTTVRRKQAPTGDRVVWDNRWQPINEITLGYTLTAVAPLTDVPAGTAERPGYVLHDLQTEWKPKAVPGLSFALAVRNIFDLRYREQTSFAAGTDNIIYEPGRDVRVSISYKF